MGDQQELQRLRSEVAKAVELLKQKHDGANITEATELLSKAREAILNNNFAQALTLVDKAQLAARPTTEYLLGKAQGLENNGSQAYKKEDFANAIELWQKSLIEYGRAQELASRRGEKEIVEAVTSTVATIEADTRTAQSEKANREMLGLVEQANKAVDEAKDKFKTKEFDAAREKFETARELYTKGAAIARELGSGDEAKLREMDAEIAASIEACLLGKGEMLIEIASREKGEKKEAAFSEVVRHLESFTSDNESYEELKTKAYQGVALGRQDVGLGLMEEAERLLEQREYYQAKEGYRKAQEHLENLRDFVVERRLEREKGEVDNLIDDCAANIKACTDSMLGKRERVAEGRIRRVEDLRKGIKPRPIPEGLGDEKMEKLKTEYQLLRYLGGGGFGDVYLAKNKEGVTLAIKVPRELDKRGEEIFFRELEVWGRLNHRNIVRLIRPRVTPIPLFEMEYIEGGDLGKLLQNVRVLSPERACRIAFDIARGLQYAHSSHNVIHTDLKPRNILLTNLEEAKVSDWGLGKVATSSSGIRGYTEAYAAPEQLAEGKAEEKTDIHQLGVLFYEMLTGRNPFAGGAVYEVREKVLNFGPDKLSRCAGDSKIEPLDDMALRCLEKTPQDRPSIRQFREAIYQYMKESHGVSLHLTEEIGSQINLLCRMALLEAKEGNYAGLLPCLERLKSLVHERRRRQNVQNLIEAMAVRKKQEMEIGDEAIDELNALLRWIEYG